MYKGLRSTIDQKQTIIANNTICHNDHKFNGENNTMFVKSKNCSNNIIEPTSKNYSNMNKETINIPNFKDSNSFEIQNAAKTQEFKKALVNVDSKINNSNNLKIKNSENGINPIQVNVEINEEKNILKISNMSNIIKNREVNNDAKSISKEKAIKPINNLERYNNHNLYNINKKNKNRIYNEELFVHHLYNPKKSLINNQLENKNMKNPIFSNKNELLNFNSENIHRNKIVNNLEKVINEEFKNDKRLKTKNKSFANANFNWNNFIFTSKANNIVPKKNYSNISYHNNAAYWVNYKSKMNNIDSFLKTKLKNMQIELANKASKNLNVNKLNNKVSEINLNREKIQNINNNKNNFINIENSIYKSQNDNKTVVAENFDLQNEKHSKNITKNRIKEWDFELNIHENINERMNVLKDCKNIKQEVDINYLGNQTARASFNLRVNEENKENIIFNQIEKTSRNDIYKDIEINNSNLIAKTSGTQAGVSKTDLKNNKSSIEINLNKNSFNNIKVFENESELNYIDLSKLQRLESDKDLILNNINVTDSDIYKEAQLESEFSPSKEINNKTNFPNESSNAEKTAFTNEIEMNEDLINKLAEDNNILNNFILDSKESLNYFNKNTDKSICSEYADDIEDMNTIIRKLDFSKNSKYEDSIFNLNSKIHFNFNIHFKNEFEAYLFPQK